MTSDPTAPDPVAPSVHDLEPEPVGFIGLGIMGRPMATNLVRAGTPLVVWNRSSPAAVALGELGARVAHDPVEVFDRARIVILMLVDETATDTVLRRGTPAFADLVRDHVVISTASVAPGYSRDLASDIHACGGRYVEAPVSGSRVPAEAGQLIALLGGDPDTVAEVRPVLAPICRATIACGPIGHGLLMKLAVNLYLDTTLAALAEALHFAERTGLDPATFQAAIDAGQLASGITRVKIPTLIRRDFAVQAATGDAFVNTRLIAQAARAAGVATPLLDLAGDLYGESVDLGNGRLDMSSVLLAIEARTGRLDEGAT